MVQTGAFVATTTGTLNTNKIRGFGAAWGGWASDGMDAFIYALALGLVTNVWQLAVVIGLFIIPFAHETRGRALPA